MHQFILNRTKYASNKSDGDVSGFAKPQRRRLWPSLLPVRKPQGFAWLLVLFLVASNLAIVYSYQSHLKNEKRVLQHKVELPDEQLGRYFKTALDLDGGQVDQFRLFRQNYNRNANKVLADMQLIRHEMLLSLKRVHPDREQLSRLSDALGEKHKELKGLTFDYYFNMQSVLKADQQAILVDIFQAMLTSEGYAETHGRQGAGGANGQQRGRRWSADTDSIVIENEE